MATTETKQLGQARPSDTNAASLYSPGSGVTARLETLIVVNTTDTAATFNAMHDEDGTTYDENTAVWWEEEVPANSKVKLSPGITMANSSGNFAIQQGTASALTFSLYGTETS